MSDASEVLEENMVAREAHDSVFSARHSRRARSNGLKKKPPLSGSGPGCEKNLAELGEPWSITKEIRENTMTGPIDALRVKGDRAWALYHGAMGKDYAIKMEKEDDEWKVDSLTTTEVR